MGNIEVTTRVVGGTVLRTLLETMNLYQHQFGCLGHSIQKGQRQAAPSDLCPGHLLFPALWVLSLGHLVQLCLESKLGNKTGSHVEI